MAGMDHQFYTRPGFVVVLIVVIISELITVKLVMGKQFLHQPSSMLSELRNYWVSNNGLIGRDIVHLFTKRNNTGTGGIAYLTFFGFKSGFFDQLCQCGK